MSRPLGNGDAAKASSAQSTTATFARELREKFARRAVERGSEESTAQGTTDISLAELPHETKLSEKVNPMADEPFTRPEMEARFREQEAKTERRFAELLGELRTANAELRGDIKEMRSDIRGELRELSAKSAGKWTVIGTGLTVLIGIGAILVTMATIGQQMFGLGASTTSAAREAAQAAIEQSEGMR